MNQYDSYFAYYDIQVDNPLKSQQIIGWLKTVDYILVHSILNQLQMNDVLESIREEKTSLIKSLIQYILALLPRILWCNIFQSMPLITQFPQIVSMMNLIYLYLCFFYDICFDKLIFSLDTGFDFCIFWSCGNHLLCSWFFLTYIFNLSIKSYLQWRVMILFFWSGDSFYVGGFTYSPQDAVSCIIKIGETSWFSFEIFRFSIESSKSRPQD